jgi:predicted RNA-binding Zn-ribbon protein involved in translation (DUF1610 family)
MFQLQLSRTLERSRRVPKDIDEPKNGGFRFYCSECGHTLFAMTSLERIGISQAFPTPFSLTQRLKECPNCGKQLTYRVNVDEIRIRKVR